jgi:GlpG protein
MRQIGNLTSADDAQRFAAYLVTQHIGAVAEADAGAWTIWIKDEDKLPQAREALEQFRANPQDPRYSNAGLKATQMQRDERDRHAAAKKNVVEMRGRWSSGPGGVGGSPFRAAPLTCVLIGLSLFVSLTSNYSPLSTGYRMLMLYDPVSRLRGEEFDGLGQLKEGQVWRLVTPIFLHGDTMHLVFNMIMLYVFGRRFEGRYKAWRMALLVLTIAVVETLATYFWTGRTGIGMSGVVYGLFGFLWMKTLYDPQPDLAISQGTVYVMIVMLFLNMAAGVEPFKNYLTALQGIDNTAHFVGLAIGMAAAGATLLKR